MSAAAASSSTNTIAEDPRWSGLDFLFPRMARMQDYDDPNQPVHLVRIPKVMDRMRVPKPLKDAFLRHIGELRDMAGRRTVIPNYTIRLIETVSRMSQEMVRLFATTSHIMSTADADLEKSNTSVRSFLTGSTGDIRQDEHLRTMSCLSTAMVSISVGWYVHVHRMMTFKEGERDASFGMATCSNSSSHGWSMSNIRDLYTERPVSMVLDLWYAYGNMFAMARQIRAKVQYAQAKVTTSNVAKLVLGELMSDSSYVYHRSARDGSSRIVHKLQTLSVDKDIHESELAHILACDDPSQRHFNMPFLPIVRYESAIGYLFYYARQFTSTEFCGMMCAASTPLVLGIMRMAGVKSDELCLFRMPSHITLLLKHEDGTRGIFESTQMNTEQLGSVPPHRRFERVFGSIPTTKQADIEKNTIRHHSAEVCFPLHNLIVSIMNARDTAPSATFLLQTRSTSRSSSSSSSSSSLFQKSNDTIEVLKNAEKISADITASFLEYARERKLLATTTVLAYVEPVSTNFSDDIEVPHDTSTKLANANCKLQFWITSRDRLQTHMRRNIERMAGSFLALNPRCISSYFSAFSVPSTEEIAIRSTSRSRFDFWDNDVFLRTDIPLPSDHVKYECDLVDKTSGRTANFQVSFAENIHSTWFYDMRVPGWDPSDVHHPLSVQDMAMHVMQMAFRGMSTPSSALQLFKSHLASVLRERGVTDVDKSMTVVFDWAFAQRLRLRRGEYGALAFLERWVQSTSAEFPVFERLNAHIDHKYDTQNAMREAEGELRTKQFESRKRTRFDTQPSTSVTSAKERIFRAELHQLGVGDTQIDAVLDAFSWNFELAYNYLVEQILSPHAHSST